MPAASLSVTRWINVQAPVNAVALAQDGRHLLAGSEHDLRLLDRWGNQRFRYFAPPPAGQKMEEDMPFSAVVLAPDLQVALAGRRSGELYRLNLTWQDEQVDVWPQQIRVEPNDLYSLSLAAEAGLIAIGHLGPALTVLDLTGQQYWRRHSNDRTATDSKTWVVGLSQDGTTLYAGSSGSGRSVLAALDAKDGKPKAAVRLEQRVTLLAVLHAQPAVAVVLTSRDECRLVGFESDLHQAVWEHLFDSDERVTAMVSDPDADLLAVGTNSGRVLLLNATTGKSLAHNDGLRSTVLSVAASGGRYMAAGLQDGQIALLAYEPADEEVVL